MILSSLLPARLLRLLPRRVSRSLLNKSATGPHARTPSPRKAFRQSGRLFCQVAPPKSVAWQRVADQHSESVRISSCTFLPFVVVAVFDTRTLNARAENGIFPAALTRLLLPPLKTPAQHGRDSLTFCTPAAVCGVAAIRGPECAPALRAPIRFPR